jgi:predicted enzyme related to lactoylglutathione lyase
MSSPTLGNGKICYIELPAIDLDTSISFYKNVFGWKVRQRSDGSMAFDDGVSQVSGTWVMGRKPSATVGMLVYVMVDDAKATLEIISKNGGKIIQPIGKDHPEITARFEDPAGNILGIYQEPG